MGRMGGQMTEQYKIAEQLGESAPQAVALIGRIVRRLGPEQARQLAKDAIVAEEAGGMLTDDASRRRTPGGIFFVLVRQHLRVSGQEHLEREFFPRRQQRPNPTSTPPRPAQAAAPPPAQGRLRPRMRGRTELPPATLLTPRPTDSGIMPDGQPPSQAVVLAILDRHLGLAPDIYRRSYNPTSGAITLWANFPIIANARYSTALAAAAAEAGVPISIGLQAHQGMLAAAARAALPEDCQIGRVTVQNALEVVSIEIATALDSASQEAAHTSFQATTGWKLELIVIDDLPPQPLATGPRDPNGALSDARRLLPPDSGCYSIGAQNAAHILVLRFHFPDVARGRYAAAVDAIRAATGWDVVIHPSPHQEMLAAAARATLPVNVQSFGAPSLRFEHRTITLRYRGDFPEAERTAASAHFQQETGWSILLSLDE